MTTNLDRARVVAAKLRTGMQSAPVEVAVLLNRALTVGLGAAPGTPVRTGWARGSFVWSVGGSAVTSPSRPAGSFDSGARRFRGAGGRFVAGYRVAEDDQIRRQLSQFRLEDRHLEVTNVSPHFYPGIDPGRRFAAGQMRGSALAPRGVSGPALLATIAAIQAGYRVLR